VRTRRPRSSPGRKKRGKKQRRPTGSSSYTKKDAGSATFQKKKTPGGGAPEPPTEKKEKGGGKEEGRRPRRTHVRKRRKKSKQGTGPSLSRDGGRHIPIPSVALSHFFTCKKKKGGREKGKERHPQSPMSRCFGLGSCSSIMLLFPALCGKGEGGGGGRRGGSRGDRPHG